MRNAFRHGDVLIIEATDAPDESVVFEPSNILHQGDNHSHSISSGSALIGTDKSGHKWLRCASDVTLDHLEHGKGVIPAGLYKVSIKMEYDHFKEESLQVRD